VLCTIFGTKWRPGHHPTWRLHRVAALKVLLLLLLLLEGGNTAGLPSAVRVSGRVLLVVDWGGHASPKLLPKPEPTQRHANRRVSVRCSMAMLLLLQPTVARRREEAGRVVPRVCSTEQIQSHPGTSGVMDVIKPSAACCPREFTQRGWWKSCRRRNLHQVMMRVTLVVLFRA
jgi:hypothetical protein